MPFDREWKNLLKSGNNHNRPQLIHSFLYLSHIVSGGYSSCYLHGTVQQHPPHSACGYQRSYVHYIPMQGPCMPPRYDHFPSHSDLRTGKSKGTFIQLASWTKLHERWQSKCICDCIIIALFYRILTLHQVWLDLRRPSFP